MRFTPQSQQGAERFAQSQFRQADGAKPFQYPAIELLECIDLLQDRGAMFSQGTRVRCVEFGKPHQGAGMGAQRKKIGPKLVMQLARNFLALDVLERNRALGETPLLL